MRSANGRAAHAEIARRYARPYRKAAVADTLSNLRRGELRRLFRDRLGDAIGKFRLDMAINEALGPVSPASPQAGARVRLTFEEKTRLGIRLFRCFDRTPAEVAKHYAEQRKARNRERQRRRRAKPKALSKRATETLTAVSRAWRRASEIADTLASSRRFSKRKLAPDAMRQAVHRALDELVEAGAVEQQRTTNRRGQTVRLVRLARKREAVTR